MDANRFPSGNYKPRKKATGSVLPYLMEVKLKRQLNTWLQESKIGIVESETGLTGRVVFSVINDCLLSLSVRQLRKAARIQEENGNAEAVKFIHRFKLEEL